MRTLILTLLLVPCVVWAHTQEPSGREAGEWVLMSILFLAGAWYAAGYAHVWHSSRTGRATLARRGALFAGGWLVIAASLLSPLHELGGRSFTAHMIEHELLMLVAAPLIAFARPLGVFTWALPRTARHTLGGLGHQNWFASIWRSVSTPLSASLIQAAMLWLWHAPIFFDAALRSELWHAAQHVSLVFSALLFWWSINTASGVERKHGMAGFYLFFTSVHSALLGALMTFAESPWYSQYVRMGMSGTAGLTPLEDQQMAGLIMWVPGGAVHALAALVYLSRWFRMPRKAIAGVTMGALWVVGLESLSGHAHAATVYVSDEERNVVHVLDVEGRERSSIQVGMRPRGMVLSRDAKMLYVAVSNDNRIDAVDLDTSQVVGHLPSGPDPEVIALHPDGRRILVANEADNLVSVVDVRLARIIAEVPVGAEPEGMAVSPDGSVALCTSESSSMAHFIAVDGERADLIDNVMVDTRPRFAIFTTDSRHVWVSSEARATVAVFDVATRRRIGLVDFEKAAPELAAVQAVGIQLTRDTERAFVALGRGNQVAEVDPKTLAVVRYFPAGGRVWNIALAPDDSRLYAAAGLSGELTVIDLVTNLVATTVKLGGRPWGVVVAP
jgi:PQQ-dependent catabolism-associated beta-propeller protein